MASWKCVVAFSLITMMLACGYARSITDKKSDPKFRSEHAIFYRPNEQNKDFGDFEPWGNFDTWGGFNPLGYEDPRYHGYHEHEDYAHYEDDGREDHEHEKALIQQQQKNNLQDKFSKIDK